MSRIRDPCPAQNISELSARFLLQGGRRQVGLFARGGAKGNWVVGWRRNPRHATARSHRQRQATKTTARLEPIAARFARLALPAGIFAKEPPIDRSVQRRPMGFDPYLILTPFTLSLPNRQQSRRPLFELSRPTAHDPTHVLIHARRGPYFGPRTIGLEPTAIGSIPPTDLGSCVFDQGPIRRLGNWD